MQRQATVDESWRTSSGFRVIVMRRKYPRRLLPPPSNAAGVSSGSPSCASCPGHTRLRPSPAARQPGGSSRRDRGAGASGRSRRTATRDPHARGRQGRARAQRTAARRPQLQQLPARLDAHARAYRRGARPGAGTRTPGQRHRGVRGLRERRAWSPTRPRTGRGMWPSSAPSRPAPARSPSPPPMWRLKRAISCPATRSSGRSTTWTTRTCAS